MRKYLLKRLLIMIPVFFGITIMVFCLVNWAPGSPVDAMITDTMTAEDIEELRINMGLDEPIYIQYGKWMGRMLTGDLGYSYPVSYTHLQFGQHGMEISVGRGPFFQKTGFQIVIQFFCACL